MTTDSSNPDKSNGQTALKIVRLVLVLAGVVMVGIVLIKASIIGFYDTDLVWMGIVSLVGAALLWVGTQLDNWIDG